MSTLASALSTLAGQELSSIEFVRDYLQLRFDAATLTVLTPPYLTENGKTLFWYEYGFKDELCKLIGCSIRSSEVTADYVCIAFNNPSVLYISLRADDYAGPEALELRINDQIYVA